MIEHVAWFTSGRRLTIYILPCGPDGDQMFDHFAAPAPLSTAHRSACAGGPRSISGCREHAGFRDIFLDQAKYAAGAKAQAPRKTAQTSMT
jgi:hypothetical protein